MRKLIFILLLFATGLYAQESYEIIHYDWELEYGEAYCSTCPGKSGVEVSIFNGVVIKDIKTGEVKAKIPAPFKPRLIGGYVEIKTQTAEDKVDGYPTRFSAKFGDYVLSNYSSYPSFPAMVDSLRLMSEHSFYDKPATTTGTKFKTFETTLTRGQTSFIVPDIKDVLYDNILLFVQGQHLSAKTEYTKNGNVVTFTSYVGIDGAEVILKYLP